MDPTYRKLPLINFGLIQFTAIPGMKLSVVPTLWQQRTISRKKSHRISSIRRRGYLLHVSVWLPFEGGVYFDQWRLEKVRIRVIQWQLLDAGSSTHNLSVLLSAMEKSCTTQTALALARRPSSELFVCTFACATCCSGYYSRAGSSPRNTVSSSVCKTFVIAAAATVYQERHF